MKRYPSINGLRLNTKFIEAKCAVLEMSYDTRPLNDNMFAIFDPDKESDIS